MRRVLFVQLPSGTVINADRIEYFGKVNAVKQPRAKKVAYWTLSIQFIGEPDPVTFAYDTEELAKADYTKLSKTINYDANND